MVSEGTTSPCNKETREVFAPEDEALLMPMATCFHRTLFLPVTVRQAPEARTENRVDSVRLWDDEAERWNLPGPVTQGVKISVRPRSCPRWLRYGHTQMRLHHTFATRPLLHLLRHSWDCNQSYDVRTLHTKPTSPRRHALPSCPLPTIKPGRHDATYRVLPLHRVLTAIYSSTCSMQDMTYR